MPVDGSVEIPSDIGSSTCGSAWTSSLCGGQSGLTFVYQVLADTSRVEPGSGLLYDNGAIFFMLRGDCHYWAQDRALSEPREGVTSPEELDRLFGLARLCNARGAFEGTAHDGATERLATREGIVHCTRGCSGDPVPVTVRQVATDAYSATLALWERGRPIEGGYRILVVSGVKQTATTRAFEWPLARPIGQFSVTGLEAVELGVGTSHPITDPQEIALLTDLRQRHQAFTEFQRGPYIRIGSTGIDHALWIRRMIPLEDARGIVPVQELLTGSAGP